MPSATYNLTIKDKGPTVYGQLPLVVSGLSEAWLDRSAARHGPTLHRQGVRIWPFPKQGYLLVAGRLIWTSVPSPWELTTRKVPPHASVRSRM